MFYQRRIKFKEEFLIKFAEVFSSGLGRCNKMKAKFELKQNVQPGFKKKKNVVFALLKQINDGLYRLGKKWVFYLMLTIAIDSSL